MIEIFRKIAALVDRSTRWQAIVVIVVIIFGALLETLSIGLIFPFIKLIIDPAEIQNMPLIGDLIPTASLDNQGRLLILLTIGILGLFVFKNLVLLWVYYIQARFAIYNMRTISLRLYQYYLKGPYSLHLVRNSADLLKNIHSACFTAFGGGFMGFVNLASEMLLMVGVALLLIVIDPLMTLGAGLVVGGSVSLFYLLFRRHTIRWGQRTLESSKSIQKELQQGLHSIKEVMVLGREKFLVNAYKDPLNEFTFLLVVQQIMAQAPRLWVETVTIASLLGVVLYVLTSGGSVKSLLPFMSVFAVAAMRLIPSINRIMIALNRVNDAKHSVDVVYQDIEALKDIQSDGEDGKGDVFKFAESLKVENVSFNYENTDAPALKEIDLTIDKGGSIGLVGSSGAGKSTLVDIILGLLKPTSGRVAVDGIDIASAPKAWQRRLGYVPQAIYLIDASLRQNIALGLEPREINEAKIAKAVHQARLAEVVDRLPDGLDTVVGENGSRLSGGQRQRVGIARALYRDPEVLIFDEATSSLDSETEHEINMAIERLSGEKTVIIIAHRLSTVRKCDRVVFLDEGRVLDIGTFDALATRNKAFQNLVDLSKL